MFQSSRKLCRLLGIPKKEIIYFYNLVYTTDKIKRNEYNIIFPLNIIEINKFGLSFPIDYNNSVS